MSKISPRVGIIFRKIFGVEENKDLLMSLINSIITPYDQISEIIFISPYDPKNFKEDELSILDIKAQNSQGQIIQIEIQIGDEANYDTRALYYWAKIYTERLKLSEDYPKPSKAIGIHILNFVSIPEVQRYHNIFHITKKDNDLLHFKNLELHTIELKKFSKYCNEKLSDIAKKVKSSLDMWIAFLTRHDLLKVNNLPKKLNDANLKKAINVLESIVLTTLERDEYEDYLQLLITKSTLKNIQYEDKKQIITLGI